MRFVRRIPLRVAIPALLLVTALAINGYQAYQDMRRSDAEVETAASAFLVQEMTQLQGTVSREIRTDDWEGVQATIADRGSNPNITAALLMDDRNTVLSSTSMKQVGAFTPEVIGNLDTELLSTVRNAMSGRLLLAKDRSVMDGYYPVLLGARPGELRPTRKGVLFTRYDLTAPKAVNRRKIERDILIDSAFDTALFLLLGLILHAALTTRVTRLVKTAGKIASGDFSAHAGLSGRDEIAQIGEAFDNMIDKMAGDQKRLLTIFDSLEAIVYVADMKTYEVLFVNRYARDLFGDIEAKICWQAIQTGQAGPCDFCTNKRIVDAEGNPAGSYTWEFQNTRTGRWFYITDRAVRWSDGRIVRLEIAFDITERKRAAQFIEQAATEWIAAMDASADVIYLLDLNRRVVRANRAFFKMARSTPEAVVGKHIADIVHPEGEAVPCPVCRAQEEKRDFEYIMERDHPDNPTGRPIEIVLRVIRDKQGQPVSMLMNLHDLTHERERQDEKTKAEAQYRTILRTAMDGFLIVDVNGRILEVNDAYCIMTGYRREELLALSIADMEAALSAKEVDRRIPKIIEQGKARFESSHRRKDGGIVDLDISVNYSPYQGGRLITFLRDVTDRKRAEEALQASERFLESIVENIPNMIFVKDADTLRFVRFNRAGEQLLGYSRDELLGKNDYDFFPRQEADFFTSNDRLVLARNELVDIPEETVRTRDKGERVLHTKKIPIRDDAGKAQFLLGISEDITERKEREAFIRNILESVDEGFIVVDREYRVQSANRAFCRLAGLAEDKVVGRTCYELSHHCEKPCFELGEECAVKHTFETGASHSVTHAHANATGATQHVEIKSYPITDASGNVISAIETMNDITEKRRLEDQLRQSQKMEAIGQLAGGVAHDFNNILMAIMGYGNLIQMKMPANDPLRLNMNPLLESAERAAQLTKSLLAFSRKQVMHMAPVSLNEIISRTEKFLRRIIGEDVELRTAPGRDALVLADNSQIEQILMNLATNARDAMPEGGILSIGTDVLEIAGAEVMAHGLDAPGSYVVISVIDTGAGMGEETLRKIFEPFFTTKELGRGTGLGLAIVYGIVKQHHGAINVSSQPGMGTTFRIYLPVHHGVAGHREPVMQAAPIVGGTETILLAEDDQVLRAFLSELLGEFGYTVIAAEDGVDAVRKFAEHADVVRLCILDMIMPRKGGKEAYEEIARLRPGIKAIFASGYAADKVRREGFPAGCEFIQKPAAPEVFLRKIRELLDREQGPGAPV